MVMKMDLSAATRKMEPAQVEPLAKAVVTKSVSSKRKQMILELDEQTHLKLKLHSATIGKPMRVIVGELIELYLEKQD